MSKIEWNLTGERLFEGGVEKGVHYPAVVDENKKVTYPKGYAKRKSVRRRSYCVVGR